MKPKPPAVRILIADDHPIVREGLRQLLELQPGFTVVGEAGDGEEALDRAKTLRPDVLLLDLAMPRMHGLEVLQALSGDASSPRVVLLTAAVEREETVTALRLGARGVVLKEAATPMLHKCIRAVMGGDLWVGHDTLDDMVKTLRQDTEEDVPDGAPASQLTPRERQVISAIVEGATNKLIGQQFGLSEQTVKNHISHIFDKLGVSNRLELGLYAIHHRLLDPRPSSPRAGVNPPVDAASPDSRQKTTKGSAPARSRS